MSDVVKEQILKSYGLLDPWYVQLGNFWKNLLSGDLGKSIVYRKNTPCINIILPKMVTSFKFGIVALVIQNLVGLPLGIFMAQRKDKLLDKCGNLYILVINAVPAAVYYLMVQLGGSSLLGVTMLYKAGKLSSCILPVICLSLGGIATNAMWIRRHMVDQKNQDYVRLARAKGLTSSQVSFRHILRNAFIPMAQSLPRSIIFTLAGSLYVESLFSIPGMGALLVTAIQRQDNPLVQAVVLFFSAMSVISMLFGDLAMMVCDPRIRLSANVEGR